jgi:SRSO17 transposase
LAAEKPRSGGGELATIERWPDALGELHTRVADRFHRPEVRERARRYLAGLLGRLDRKNGWQMAERMGEMGPQGAQRLLNAARWDADAVRDDLRGYVIEHLGEEQSGVLIVDETGFLKKGEKSVGVARQYTGTAGRIENAQVGVFVAYYASEKGAAFVDRVLYLPREEWSDNPLRRAEAGVLEEVRFATKGELAKEMLRRAFKARVPARWVVCGHGIRDGSELARMARRAGALLRAGGTGHQGHLPRGTSAAGTIAGQGPTRRWVGSSIGRRGKQGR